jgi:hypothetical protein
MSISAVTLGQEKATESIEGGLPRAVKPKPSYVASGDSMSVNSIVKLSVLVGKLARTAYVLSSSIF